MSNNDQLAITLKDTLLSRRSFLKWSAAVGGTAIVANSLDLGLKAIEASAQADASAGEWIPAACWHNCGGRCLLKAQVVDGVVTRVKTDDTHADSPDFPQQRACVRGRSQRSQVFGADRLKYPMKRKHWEPGGGDKSLRGKDEWERISWEEALDYVADELKRVKETYGNESILAMPMGRLLSAYGGAWETWGMVSSGAWPAPDKHMAGRFQFFSFGGPGGHNDRLDMRNSRLIVLWGANPAWSSQGSPTYHYLQAKKAGAKIICVDPKYTATATALADEWIPVRPGTDTALLLGIAYYMIENDLQDQDFLDTYAVGFDAAHMPEGADRRENFKDYVLGTYDGVPKTPEWASEICGTDPALIRSFALELATTKPAQLLSSFAPARTYRGEQFAQAFLTVGWMTGNVGLPGAAVSDCGHTGAANGGAMLVAPGGSGVPGIENPVCQGLMAAFMGGSMAEKPFGIVWDETWDAVVNGEFTNGREKKAVDIHLIYSLGVAAALNQQPNINQGIEAYRKVDFVVTSAHFLTTPARYSDIVLPATTEWERWGTVLTGNREAMFWDSQVVEPIFEAKDDSWMEVELAKRLGIDPLVIEPIPLKQQIFNQIAGATVVTEDGVTYEPLATITAADLETLGVDGAPQTGRIPILELKQQGVYQVPRAPGDNFGYIAYQAFREDPEANPLPTVSGKLHIHSQALVDDIAAYGWITDLAPVAQYVPPVEGYEDTFSDWENRVKGDYPLQLYTPHYLRRSHSILDNNLWLRKAWPEELVMNTLDAEERGLQTGDIVKVTSRHGVVIRPVQVTAEMLPGVVALGEGAWVDRDDETGIDRAGATNSLSGTLPCGQGVQPWNTNNAQVEKYTGTLPSDYSWPQRIVLKEE